MDTPPHDAHKHGLTQEEGEQLLQLLRECAHAPPMDTPPHDALSSC